MLDLLFFEGEISTIKVETQKRVEQTMPHDEKIKFLQTNRLKNLHNELTFFKTRS